MRRRRTGLVCGSWLVAALFGLSVVFIGCGGGGSGGGGAAATPKIQLSGTVGAGYTVAANPSSVFFAKALSFLGYPISAYAIASPSVDKVIAIPMDGGSLDARKMANTQTATIDPTTKAFSLSLAKDTDWLLVLINSAGTSTTRFVGSLALNTGSSDSLLSLPATVATQTSLNLGTVSGTGNDALTSTVVGTADFSLTTNQLTMMAKTDDIFRNAKNIVNNYNVGTGIYYQLRPDFSWVGNFSTLSTTYSNPGYTFRGMTFQLDTNSSTINMTQLCNLGTVNVGLFPSIPISDGSHTYDASTPISNSGATGCSTVNGFRQLNGDIYATDAYASGGPGLSYSTMPLFPTVPLPAVTWTWKETVASVTTDKAVFDVATINPPVNSDGTPKGFVPSFRINTNPTTTTKIDSVDIRWYYYDGGTYTAVAPADLALLKHFVSSMEIKFDVTDGGVRRTCDMYFDPATTTNVIPGNFASSSPNCALTWYYNDVGHPQTNTGLMGFYESGGFGYFFNFFKP